MQTITILAVLAVLVVGVGALAIRGVRGARRMSEAHIAQLQSTGQSERLSEPRSARDYLLRPLSKLQVVLIIAFFSCIGIAPLLGLFFS